MPDFLLKIFDIHPIRATFSCFAGSEVILFHASMKKYELLTPVSFYCLD